MYHLSPLNKSFSQNQSVLVSEEREILIEKIQLNEIQIHLLRMFKIKMFVCALSLLQNCQTVVYKLHMLAFVRIEVMYVNYSSKNFLSRFFYLDS